MTIYDYDSMELGVCRGISRLCLLDAIRGYSQRWSLYLSSDLAGKGLQGFYSL
jgi:hypothetical protein